MFTQTVDLHPPLMPACVLTFVGKIRELHLRVNGQTWDIFRRLPGAPQRPRQPQQLALPACLAERFLSTGNVLTRLTKCVRVAAVTSAAGVVILKGRWFGSAEPLLLHSFRQKKKRTLMLPMFPNYPMRPCPTVACARAVPGRAGSGLGPISRSSGTAGADTGRAPSISTAAARTDPAFPESSPYQVLVELLELHRCVLDAVATASETDERTSKLVLKF